MGCKCIYLYTYSGYLCGRSGERPPLLWFSPALIVSIYHHQRSAGRKKKKKKYQNIKPPRMMLTWYTQPLLKKYGFSVLSPFFSFDWPPDCLSILIQLFFCFSSLCFLKLVCLMVETTSSWLPHFLSNIFAFISPHPQVVGGRNRKNGLKLLPPKRRRRRSVGWRMYFDSSIWWPIW